MKRYILMLFISCCLIFVCIYAFLREKEKINQFEFEKSNFKQFFVSNIFRDIDYEMSGQIQLLDVDGTEVEWSHIVGKGPKLILFINNITCEYCISSEIRLMKEYLGNLRTDDIIILTGFSNLNSNNIIAKKYELNYKIYNVVNNSMMPDFIHNPVEPILFILNENNKIKYLYTPNKNLSFISQEYYNLVNEYFLHQYKIIDNNNNGIYFEKLVFDIGSCQIEADTLFEIEYKNMMDKPLIIQDIQSSCGCSNVTWKKEPLAPGKNSQIRIRYTPNNQGIFAKSIIIKSNAPNSPIKLILKGNVVN